MIIKDVIWIKEFSEKLERSHHVSQDEVEEVFATQPPVRRMRRGARKGEDVYRAVGQTDAGRYLAQSFSFTKVRDEASSFLVVMQIPRS